MTAKVNELLENDIIERMEGPTTWISPVVVAPKPSGDIRLCVEAIVRESLPIPTVDEVLESLNGSTVCFLSLICVGVLIRSNWNPTRGMLLFVLLMM